MIKVTSDQLTKKEKMIYKAIVFQGLGLRELVHLFGIKMATIKTHIDHISYKRQIWDASNRCQQIQALFWREFLKVKNCSKCKFWDGAKCDCPDSQFYGDAIKDLKTAQNMICTHLEEKRKVKVIVYE